MNFCTVGNYPNCLEVNNGSFRLAVSVDFGPRILGAFVDDGPNMLKVMPNLSMPEANNGFTLYGGHRLWHSPEAMPRTYAPDNMPVAVREIEDGYEFECETEPLTGIRKSLLLELGEDSTFHITHRLTNCGLWPVTLAPWAITMMAPGGLAIIPQLRAAESDQYTPDRALVLWPYANFNDPRLFFGDNYICLRQDPTFDSPCKIGFSSDGDWIGYANQGYALIKYFEPFLGPEIRYPDRGCNVASYCNADFCEIESMAPLYELTPGEHCEHVEHWQGIFDLPDLYSIGDIEEYLEPMLL